MGFTLEHYLYSRMFAAFDHTWLYPTAPVTILSWWWTEQHVLLRQNISITLILILTYLDLNTLCFLSLHSYTIFILLMAPMVTWSFSAFSSVNKMQPHMKVPNSSSCHEVIVVKTSSTKRIEKFVKQTLYFLFNCHCATHTHWFLVHIYKYIYIYSRLAGRYKSNWEYTVACCYLYVISMHLPILSI